MVNHPNRSKISLNRLIKLGIDEIDASALRRISMTLHRWHELECGSGNDYRSWAIERENEDGTGKPYHVSYWHDGRTTRMPIPDRENGALKRLAKILERYPELEAYIQTDPRGCALYILRPGDVPEGERADAHYSRGIAVY